MYTLKIVDFEKHKLLLFLELESEEKIINYNLKITSIDHFIKFFDTIIYKEKCSVKFDSIDIDVNEDIISINDSNLIITGNIPESTISSIKDLRHDIIQYLLSF